MYVFGSTAVKHYFPDFREPNDLDIIDKLKALKSNKVEVHYTKAFKYLDDINAPKYLTPDLLYTIKVSHAAWDIKWEKTMKDIEFLKDKGAKLDLTFYNSLYKDWESLHGPKNVKMNVHNKDFFKENISRDYDHDWLHQQFKYYNKPLNFVIREDLNSPKCSEYLWDKLSYEDKIKCALEEIYVIAFERYIYISKGYPPKISIIKSLKTLITSSAKGWFNLFLIENFNILRIKDLDKFINNIKEIKCKKHKSTN